MIRAAVLAAVLSLTATAASAQGCSQCRDAVGQAPAATRAAYRRAILVMMGAGITVAGATAFVFRRLR